MMPQAAAAPARAAAAPVPVLFVVDELCRLGGAERVLLNMVRLLPRDRFAPRLLTFRIDPSLGIFDRFPCPLHVFPLRRTWGLHAAQVAWQIRSLVRREGIEIVHTFFETSDIWAGPIARLSGARILISSRRDMGILRSAKHRIAYRVANRFYDQVQTVSDQVRNYCIAEDRLAPNRVLTVYNGVDLRGAGAAERGRFPELSGASHVVATVANIRPVKGLDTLLRAAALLRPRFPEARFAIAGERTDAVHFDNLLALRAELGLERCVHFLGPLDNAFELLKAADVFLLPSRSEGLSNALLEAMACGVPCVATNTGGNPELIRDGENGFLVPVGDEAAVASRLAGLLGDAGAAKTMGRRGRALVERHFTTEAMMDELLRSYERLLDERSHDRR